MSQTRRKYTKEFKQEAVDLLLRSDKSGTQIAAELGIRQDLISRWRREYEELQEKAFPGNGNQVEEVVSNIFRTFS